MGSTSGGRRLQLSSYPENRAFSDQFIPQIARIVGEALLVPAPIDEDLKHNTDLTVLQFSSTRIACRVRRPDSPPQYRDEFTIRSAVPSSGHTELHKIVEGWGDYFFYAFAGNDGCLESWHLADLKVFRLWFCRQCLAGKVPGMERRNTDGSSNFRVFRWDALPREFVISKSHQQPQKQLLLNGM